MSEPELVERLRVALSWIEPPFVTAETSADELRSRISFCLADAYRALERLSLSDVTEDDVERVARAIGEVARSQCGGYPFNGDDPKFNPWLTDTHRDYARAAIAAMQSGEG